MIYLDIPGEPISWKRPGQKHLPTKTLVYDMQRKEKTVTRFQLASQYKEEPISTPVKVLVRFFFAAPASASKKRKELMLAGEIKHSCKPDSDNLTKYIFDCMNGLIFVDDSQVCEYHVVKSYSEIPRTEITIMALEKNIDRDPIEEADDAAWYKDYYEEDKIRKKDREGYARIQGGRITQLFEERAESEEQETGSSDCYF